jgi:hypothetical protein
MREPIRDLVLHPVSVAMRRDRIVWAANLPLETDRACGAADQRQRWAEMRMDGCLR